MVFNHKYHNSSGTRLQQNEIHNLGNNITQ